MEDGPTDLSAGRSLETGRMEEGVIFGSCVGRGVERGVTWPQGSSCFPLLVSADKASGVYVCGNGEQEWLLAAVSFQQQDIHPWAH